MTTLYSGNSYSHHVNAVFEGYHPCLNLDFFLGFPNAVFIAAIKVHNLFRETFEDRFKTSTFFQFSLWRLFIPTIFVIIILARLVWHLFKSRHFQVFWLLIFFRCSHSSARVVSRDCGRLGEVHGERDQRFQARPREDAARRALHMGLHAGPHLQVPQNPPE